MYLIIGLGNPGNEYEDHRHNIGFMVVDAIAKKHGFSAWRKKFSSLIAEGEIGGGKILLLKPQTYMNESGLAASEAMQFYKIKLPDVLAIHDELDLPLGKLKIKTGGGSAGHNGLRSLDAHIGQDYKRMRFGIGHPGNKDLVSGYVLHDFAKQEWPTVKDMAVKIVDNFFLLIAGKDSEFLKAFSG